MNCLEVRSKLSGFVDLAFQPGEHNEIEDHLKKCSQCANELVAQTQIDQLAKSIVYSEPVEEYWNTIAARVTRRLGLRHTQAAMTWWERTTAALEGLLSPRPLGWAVAGATVILLAIFWGRNFISQEPGVAKSSGQQSVIAEQPGDPEAVREKALASSEQPEVSLGESEVNEKLATGSAPSELEAQPSGTAILTAPRRQEVRETVEPLPARLSQSRAMPSVKFDGILYPIPNTEFLLKAIADAETEPQADDLGPIVRSFSREQGQQPLPIFNPQENDELTPLESDFYETLWIVQEIGSLQEKRNIWLSYLDRESDPTYQSLAIFNLAIVMSQLVEETKDVQIAREALEFYTENEEGLRLQMGFQRYELKIQFFNSIISKN